MVWSNNTIETSLVPSQSWMDTDPKVLGMQICVLFYYFSYHWFIDPCSGWRISTWERWTHIATVQGCFQSCWVRHLIGGFVNWYRKVAKMCTNQSLKSPTWNKQLIWVNPPNSEPTFSPCIFSVSITPCLLRSELCSTGAMAGGCVPEPKEVSAPLP